MTDKHSNRVRQEIAEVWCACLQGTIAEPTCYAMLHAATALSANVGAEKLPTEVIEKLRKWLARALSLPARAEGCGGYVRARLGLDLLAEAPALVTAVVSARTQRLVMDYHTLMATGDAAREELARALVNDAQAREAVNSTLEGSP